MPITVGHHMNLQDGEPEQEGRDGDMSASKRHNTPTQIAQATAVVWFGCQLLVSPSKQFGTLAALVSEHCHRFAQSLGVHLLGSPNIVIGQEQTILIAAPRAKHTKMETYENSTLALQEATEDESS